VLNFKALEVDSGGNPTKEIFLKNVKTTIKFLDSALIQLKLDYGIVMTLVEVKEFKTNLDFSRANFLVQKSLTERDEREKNRIFLD